MWPTPINIFNMNLPARAQKGFTLVELLIVITIIGLLVVALLPNLTGGRNRARDAARQSHLQQISTALEFYADDFGGQYPDTAGCIQEDLTDELDAYLTTIPQDPLTDNNIGSASNCTDGGYDYFPTSDGYLLVAAMENTQSSGPNLYLLSSLETAISGGVSTDDTQDVLSGLTACSVPGDCEDGSVFVVAR